ncbi:MAG: ATP-binding protein [Bacteroidales bacterium]|jgi:predicted AAA+ superfamily ATPase|nr:ATP-binding protein [Bacteroidales bacterium]
MIERFLQQSIENRLHKGKVIILLGARQVGKSTLLEKLFAHKSDVEWFNGDEATTKAFFSDISATRLDAYFKGKKYLIIDEAQQIEDVGLKLKLMSDKIKDLQIVATGSSAFEIANKTNEPLTGRTWEYTMYPLSFAEMVAHHGLMTEKRMLPHRLLYGYYPDVVNNVGEEQKILRLLSDSYLYKDILQWEGIQKPDKLTKLLQALAYQIGSEVSFAEIGNTIGLDSKTVEKYIDLLEKCFVVFRLGSFSRNVRNELKFSKKIYFYDTGIRNAVIADFSDINTRRDIGGLWKNFVISERKKVLEYGEIWAKSYFWRTTQQQEIDYIEEKDGQLTACKIKWSSTAKARLPLTFSKKYQHIDFKVINKDNVEHFLL